VRPENELRKSRNLLWIKAFKSQGVDSESLPDTFPKAF